MQIQYEQLFTGLGLMIPYSLMALAALWLANLAVDKILSWSSGGVSEHNTAAGIRIAGLFIAIGIGLSGVFAGSSRGFWLDLQASAGYGLLIIVMMIIALKLNDWAILPGIGNSQEVGGGNTAVGVVEFGGMIATGLIAKSAVMGDSGGWKTTIVFFILGQTAMAAMVYLYEKIVQKKYSLVDEVGGGNVAAGILLGGKLWAYGLIMSAAVGGKFTNWTYDMIAFGITAVAGMIFLYVSELLIDKVIVTDYTAKEIVDGRCVRPAMILAAGSVGMAYVISTVAI